MKLKGFWIVLLALAMLLSSFTLTLAAAKMQVTVIAASADDGNKPGNVLDGNLSTRFASNGDGAYITLGAGSPFTLEYVKIAWNNGSSRQSYFEIFASNDNQNFTKVYPSSGYASSSGSTTALETYDFSDVTARYVKVIGHENSYNTWFSPTEIEVWGSGGTGGGVTINNPGFESNFTGWTEVEPAAISTSDTHSGSRSAKLSSSTGSCYQTISGLSANTTYTLSAWFLGSGKIGARNYGGSDVSKSLNVSSWTQGSVTFTTGPSNTSVQIYGSWVSGGDFRVDDFTLVPSGAAPTPTPTIMPTPTVTPTATVTPTPTASPIATPSVSPSTPSGNLALNKPVTYSSQQSGNEANRAVDGSTSTRWSAEPYPQWIRVDLGAIYSINRTELVPYSNRAYRYKVEVSTDGTNYTQVVDRTNNTTGGSLLTDTFTNRSARYVRLTVTGCYNYTGGWASISEFRVFGGGSPVSPPPSSSVQPTPTQTPTPTPTTSTPGGINVPADLLNLTNWKLTLPIDTSHAGDPDEIKQPELDSYSHSEYFHLNSAKNGVVFKAHCGGDTTSGSGYPRSELREMTNNGSTNASWSSTSGTHTLYIKQAVTHLPVAKPHVVLGQIHDSDDDVTVFRLEGKNLYITNGDTTHGYLVDNNYQLGTIFTCKMVVSGGKIEYYYNDQKLSYSQSKNISGCYFKAGCYTQSNTSTGDSASAYGEVIIYDLQVTHN